MAERYVIGKPIETDAITNKPVSRPVEALNPRLKLLKNKRMIKYELKEDDVVYGLGESLHGMNKRGFIYVSNNTDQTKHNEDQYSLYASHNFILIDSGNYNAMGIFTDYPGKVTYDIGFSDKDALTITVEEPDYEFYILSTGGALDIISEFRTLIGKSYKAPKWGFGYGQSRWGYKNADDIREVVKNHKENDLPLTSVYMDIDYMIDYKDFTIDESKFPNFKEFVQEMKKEDIHLVPIIDAAVKLEDGYDVYEEGKNNNYFCKDEEGNDFVMAAWPGRSTLPDVLDPKVRDWFGKKYKILTDLGIDGFWNDMNEPAIFYSDVSLKEAADKLATLKDKTMNLELSELWDYLGTASGLANNDEDYKRFYHNINGEKVRHDKVHNLYGYNMTRAAAEAFKEFAPEKDILLFSRSSYIGMHRYAGIWTGDNSSIFSHIELLLHQLPNLNMCGFLYVGADTGGFAFNTSENLLKRFMQLSLFTPLFRNHSALGTKEQEIYRFKDIDSFRNLLKIRYSLIPYLYDVYVDSIENNKMMFTPLGLAYPSDKEARHIEDQLMLGSDLMITPVYKANAVGRYVYVPEDMTLYTLRSDKDYTTTDYTKGHHYISVGINEVPVFVKKGKTLKLS